MLYKSVEDANKTLAAELRCRCDMATQEEREARAGHSWEGCWDGHMAYRLVSRELFKPPVLDDVYLDCTEPDWLKEGTKHLEAYAISSSGDGAPVEEKANIFFEEEAAPGRAWRSAEHGLPAASTTPQQALQAELATTSPALPPINPGAPGYLGSSVSAEFSSLGSAFCVGGTGPGGDYLQDSAKYYAHIAAAGEGPAQTEWVECGDGGSPGEP